MWRVDLKRNLFYWFECSFEYDIRNLIHIPCYQLHAVDIILMSGRMEKTDEYKMQIKLATHRYKLLCKRQVLICLQCMLPALFHTNFGKFCHQYHTPAEMDLEPPISTSFHMEDISLSMIHNVASNFDLLGNALIADT